ncbi:MAG TPA: aldo/keto reductase [Clostridia bacterium]
MQTTIKRRKLGRTGLLVSELSLGAMNLRMLKSFDEACAIVDYVLDQGINLIDTARAYKGEISPGVMLESEQVVGQAIRQRTDLDEPIVIITKGHAYTIPELGKDLATSLETLGVSGKGDLQIGENAIKLVYFIHGISTERWDTIKSSGVLDRLQELKAQGVINHLGFSSHYPFAKEIKEAVDTGIFDVVELPYNVFNRSLGEDGQIDLFQYIHDKDIGLINMKAFNGNGMGPIYQVIKEYLPIDYPAMLRFALANPHTTSIDAGARYPAEFEADMQVACGPMISGQELGLLKAEADKVAVHMKNVCRECMHCLEKFACPNQVDFPRILSLHTRYTFLARQNKDTSELVRKYALLEKNGEDCMECGECLPWCEYRLNIPEQLKQAHQVLR